MAKFDAHLKCSFCGKSQDQVRKLIAGPGVYICDECIDLCNEIIDEEELNMLQQMKVLKKSYRATFSDLRSAKTHLNQVMQTIDVAKQQLVGGFE